MSRPIRQIARRVAKHFLRAEPAFSWLSGCSSWSGDEADSSAIEGPSGTLRRGAMLSHHYICIIICISMCI